VAPRVREYRALPGLRARVGCHCPALLTHAAGRTPLQVEQDGLWEKLAISLQAAPGADAAAVRLALREKALRFLAWIEDDADPRLVLRLQSHARRCEAVPMDDAHLTSLPAELRGGSRRELPSYVYETSPAYLEFVAETAAGSSASGSAGGPLAGSKRQRDALTAGDAAAAQLVPAAQLGPMGTPADSPAGAGADDEPVVYPPPQFSVWLPESQVRMH
jgi:hypothetical protein